MKKNKRILLVAVLGFTACLWALAWKTQTFLLRERQEFINDTSARQLAPIKRLVQNKLDYFKNHLVQIVSRKENTPQANVLGQRSEIWLLSLLQNDAGVWRSRWTEKGRMPQLQNWPAGYENELLKPITLSRIKDGEIVWTRLQAPDSRPLYSVAFSVEVHRPREASGTVAKNETLPEDISYTQNGAALKGIVVAVFSQNVFASVVEDYIGSSETVFITDAKGYIAAHTNKNFNGSYFSEDPLVKGIIEQQKTIASGTFNDLENQAVWGHYEKIDRSNLYAVVTTPVSSAVAFLADYKKVFMTTGLGMTILALIFIYLVSVRALAETEPMTASEVSKLDFAEATPDTAVSSRSSEEQKPPPESAYKEQPRDEDSLYRLGRGFSNLLREPLTAILGHLQLMRAKSQDSDLLSHVVLMEKEARRTRETLDKIGQFAGSDPGDMRPLSMKTIVQSVLSEHVQRFEQQSVELVTDLQDVPLIMAHPTHLMAVTAAILDNALEAVSSRDSKQIRIRLQHEGTRVVMKISDTGIGMSNFIRMHAFDAFYRAFENDTHIGLGLTLSQIAVKNHGGRIEASSVPGQGTEITVSFPVSLLQDDKHEIFKEEKKIPAVGFQPPLVNMSEDNVWINQLAEELKSSALLDSSEQVTEMRIRRPKIKDSEF